MIAFTLHPSGCESKDAHPRDNPTNNAVRFRWSTAAVLWVPRIAAFSRARRISRPHAELYGAGVSDKPPRSCSARLGEAPS